MKKSLMGEVKGKIKASKGVKASLLLVFNLFARPWGPTSLFCSLIRLVKRLLQGLRQAQDPGIIGIEI